MATTAWKFAATASTYGSGADWNYAGNALTGNELSSDNDVRAMASIFGAGTTRTLRARNFGFTSSDVPSGNNIDGVEIRVRRLCGTSSSKDATIQLTNGTTASTAPRIGNNKASASTWPTTEAAATYGGASDLWGATLTQAIVTSSAFGLDIQVIMSGFDGAEVDSVECRIHHSAGGGPTYTLTAAQASFTLTGQSNAFKRALRVVASAASFTLTGVSAVVGRVLRMSADGGAFSLTGLSAGLSRARTLIGNTGAFSLSGQGASIVASRKLTAAGASFSWSGTATTLRVGRKIVAETASLILSGGAASLTKVRRLAADTGSFVLTGIGAGLTASRRLGAQSATFTLAGVSTGLARVRTLSANAGAFALHGVSAGLSYVAGATFRLTAEPLALLLTGRLAALRHIRVAPPIWRPASFFIPPFGFAPIGILDLPVWAQPLARETTWTVQASVATSWSRPAATPTAWRR